MMSSPALQSLKARVLEAERCLEGGDGINAPSISSALLPLLKLHASLVSQSSLSTLTDFLQSAATTPISSVRSVVSSPSVQLLCEVEALYARLSRFNAVQQRFEGTDLQRLVPNMSVLSSDVCVSRTAILTLVLRHIRAPPIPLQALLSLYTNLLHTNPVHVRRLKHSCRICFSTFLLQLRYLIGIAQLMAYAGS